jgi:stage II sporulation protein D
LIVIHNNEPIIAYFHSNSGGKTINGKEYFGGKDYPYLISKRDPYSLGLKSSTWELSMKNIEFSKIFKHNGVITNRDITYNGDSFVDKMTIGTKQLNTKEIRRNVGYSVMKSERFSVELNNDNIIFRGIGYGHGVGMSQWGANNMAKEGFNFKQIIEFYYPETKIGDK